MFRGTKTKVLVSRPQTTRLATKPDFLNALPFALQRVVARSLQVAHELGVLEGTQLPQGTPAQQRDIYRRRIVELRATAGSTLKVAVALKCGYQPYTIPATWHAGYVESQKRRESWALAGKLNGRDIDYYSAKAYQPLEYVFGRPMPPDVLGKYVAVKKEKLFDEFLVAAPNPEYFIQQGRRTSGSLFIEPALVGYIATDDFREYGQSLGLCFAHSSKTTPHIRVAGGIGFLVAYWDLSGDLQAMSEP